MNYNLLNLVVAIVLSVVVIFGWQHFYEKPRLEKLAKEHEIYQEQLKSHKKKTDAKVSILSREEAIIQDKRVKIDSESLAGSISLKGLRFDDLVLHKYRKELDENSGEVELFSPSSTDQSYFAEFGWWSSEAALELPNSETMWEADKEVLKGGQSVIFSWTNSSGVLFQVEVFLDKNYMFTLKQKTINNSSKPISTKFYGLVNRIYDEPSDRMVNILHQGMVGTIGSELNEFTYDKIKEEKRKSFDRGDVAWLGITDKYWLAAMIPDQAMKYSSNFNYAVKGGKDKFQVDFVSSSEVIEAGGGVFELTHRLFAGAKNVDLLDIYESKYNIELFDRAIDFGWLYILTKPIFKVMNFCYGYVGNFGISIMIVTVLIKILMYFPANKSYRSMKKMKKLQPQMERLREMYSEDKARLNQEIMALYKREKVNPVSGCLPLLIQIPVFFSIYKVLYVTIEMRHAPFFGWIQDLSAPDPTTIFNLLGLLPFTPPSFLMIGIWPIFMAVTMFLQQRMSPEPADPVQAKVMKLMPLMFLFMFSSFPAGLLIYWSWNNILSIVQQSLINRLDNT